MACDLGLPLPFQASLIVPPVGAAGVSVPAPWPAVTDNRPLYFTHYYRLNDQMSHLE